MAINEWSTTAANNATGVTNVNWAEGQAPSTVNDSARNLMADVATWYGQASGKMPEYLTSIAGTNTITAASVAAVSALAAGQRFTFIPANTNTGATTLNITPSGGSALTAKNIYLKGAALQGGEIQQNVPVTVLYDGTQFNLIGGVAAAPANGTPQATTSGTAFDFTIPAWAKRITMTLKACSLSGTDNFLVQLSDAGGPENSGYVGIAGSIANAGASSTGTLSAGFTIGAGGNGASLSGSIIITLHNATDFTWAAQGVFGNTGDSTQKFVAGYKSLSAALTGIRLTRSGTDTFDAGEVNVLYS